MCECTSCVPGTSGDQRSGVRSGTGPLGCWEPSLVPLREQMLLNVSHLSSSCRYSFILVKRPRTELLPGMFQKTGKHFSCLCTGEERVGPSGRTWAVAGFISSVSDWLVQSLHSLISGMGRKWTHMSIFLQWLNEWGRGTDGWCWKTTKNTWKAGYAAILWIPGGPGTSPCLNKNKTKPSQNGQQQNNPSQSTWNKTKPSQNGQQQNNPFQSTWNR